jgi:hypothetical protein
VLVLIDDLDKPGLDHAKKIFYDNYTAITQPACTIVYTVPISIYFAQEFTAIRETRFFLPNVKLHIKNDRNSRYEKDYDVLNEICKDNEIRWIEKTGHLLHNLSVLEYINDENWCDIHPTLEKLLKT